MTRVDSSKRILVTGANGFIGRAVMALGAHSEYAFYGLRRDEAQDPSNLFGGDITDYTSLSGLLTSGSFDVVIHCAGLAHQFGGAPEAAFDSINVNGTENVCSFAVAARARRLVLISSVSVYGDHGDAQVNENFECRPEGAYATSKYRAELRAQEICSANGLDLIILRLATVCGPGDRGNISRLINVINDRKFLWIGHGTNKKTLIDRKDAAAAIIVAATTERNAGDGVFNICSPAVEMRNIVETIANGCGKKIWPFVLSGSLARRLADISAPIVGSQRGAKIVNTLEKWLSDDVFDGSRFCNAYEWEPSVTISDSLRAQIDAKLNSAALGFSGDVQLK